eukprot:gene629-2063_t
MIPEDDKGQVDLAHLEKELSAYRKANPERKLIGSFSAGGAGGGGCLVGVGLLQAAAAMRGKPLCMVDCNSSSSGGSVVYVDQEHHQYDTAAETREEAGTPNILGNIRCGNACALWKDAMSNAQVHHKEQSLNKAIIQGLMKTLNVIVLGSGREAFFDYKTRLGIIPFVISAKLPGGKESLLHHNFVARVLNDLYGLQLRSGCSCAGPYGWTLLKPILEPLLQTRTGTESADLREKSLHMAKPSYSRLYTKTPENQVYLFQNAHALDKPTSIIRSQFPLPIRSAPSTNEEYGLPLDTFGLPLEKNPFSEFAHTVIHEICAEGNLSLKPGWTCVSVKYVTSMEDVQFFLAAVAQVAEHGWKLLPFYRLDPSSGQWHLRKDCPLPTALVKQEKKGNAYGKKDGAAKKDLVPGCFGDQAKYPAAAGGLSSFLPRGSAAERMMQAAPQEAPHEPVVADLEDMCSSYLEEARCILSAALSMAKDSKSNLDPPLKKGWETCAWFMTSTDATTRMEQDYQ